MPSRTLPGLGLNGFWNLGEDNWKAGMDDNLRWLSVLVQGRIKSRVAALPGSPVNGDIHLMTAGANVNQIAIRDNGAWVYILPQAGFRLLDLNTNTFLRYQSGAWVDESTTTGAMQFIAAYDATGLSQLVFDNLDAFEFYEIVVEDLYASADYVLRMQTSGDNGATWSAGGSDYAFASAVTQMFEAGVGIESTNGGAWVNLIFSTTGADNTLPRATYGKIETYGLRTSGGTWKRIKYDLSWVTPIGRINNTQGWAVRQDTAAVNALRIYPSAGNFAAGKAFLYGRRNS